MDPIMDQVTTAAQEPTQTAVSGVIDFLNQITDIVEPWQLILGAGILLILAIVLIIALASRNRKYDDVVEEKEKSQLAAERAAREQEQLKKKNEEAVAAVRAEGERVIEQKNTELESKNETIDDLTGQVGELTKFREEYMAIPDARAEAGRIIREAKDRAYTVSNRTEMEYAEIIEHANLEAESIRATAQERLKRSHEALKAALARANEIVEEAQTSASRIGQDSVTYMSARGLIEAPTEEAPVDDVPEAPAELADEPAPEAPVAEEVTEEPEAQIEEAAPEAEETPDSEA